MQLNKRPNTVNRHPLRTLTRVGRRCATTAQHIIIVNLHVIIANALQNITYYVTSIRLTLFPYYPNVNLLFAAVHISSCIPIFLSDLYYTDSLFCCARRITTGLQNSRTQHFLLILSGKRYRKLITQNKRDIIPDCDE